MGIKSITPAHTPATPTTESKTRMPATTMSEFKCPQQEDTVNKKRHDQALLYNAPIFCSQGRVYE